MEVDFSKVVGTMYGTFKCHNQLCCCLSSAKQEQVYSGMLNATF